MKNKKYVLNHEFPFIEYCGIGTFLLILGISVKRYFEEESTEWIFIFIGVSVGLVFFYWLTNSRNRTIIFYQDSIHIKPVLGKTQVLTLEHIKGYQLKETYSRTGLVDYIQLIKQDGGKIQFVKDVYPEYHKLENYLKLLGVNYLGRTEIKWKYKHVYSKVGIYAFVVAVTLFILVQLMKLLK